MARVNVETAALAETRFFDFMNATGYERSKAIGILVILWHDSQERFVIQGTKEEICKFLSLNKEEKETCFDALLSCGYLKKVKSVFEIKGNKKHVEFLLFVKRRAQEAGKASGKSRQIMTEKRTRDKSVKSDSSNYKSTSSSTHSTSSQLEALAIQYKADQIDPSQTMPDQFSEMQKDICEKETSKPPVSDMSAFHPLAVLWNTNCGSLPKVREMNSKRKRDCKVRWDEHPDENYWLEVIRGITSSDFCTGKNKDSWRADFDFMLRPGTATRILEGTYGGSSKRSAPPPDARTLELFGT